jgi:hypothetical protein
MFVKEFTSQNNKNEEYKYLDLTWLI